MSVCSYSATTMQVCYFLLERSHAEQVVLILYYYYYVGGSAISFFRKEP